MEEGKEGTKDDMKGGKGDDGREEGSYGGQIDSARKKNLKGKSLIGRGGK